MAGIVGSENPTRVLTAHSIMGDKVVNTAGENLGDIKDLMIDLNKGCIAYAVLDYSTGFLNLSSKYFAVPWQAFTVDEDRKQLVLNVDKDRLESAPGFDKDHWPMANDQQYYSSVDQYYGGTYQSGTMGGGTMGGGTMGSGY
jgi:sporulation protein YlmC with PRC-barrel domain